MAFSFLRKFEGECTLELCPHIVNVHSSKAFRHEHTILAQSRGEAMISHDWCSSRHDIG